MTKPIILVSAGRSRLAAAYREVQTTTSGVDIDYVDSVVAAGGAPMILPCLADNGAIAAAVTAADGILLTGGGDVASLVYGEEPHPACTLQDPTRDEMEIKVVRLAMDQEKPILGICRGIDFLNVSLGGTLVQDIPSQVKGPVKHSSRPLAPILIHSVDIAEDSLLARVIGQRSLAVNSYHHQAAKDIGQGLTACCWARDGVVEGLESSEGKPILAVQFHPEEVALANPEFLALFEWLAREACRRKEAATGPAPTRKQPALAGV